MRPYGALQPSAQVPVPADTFGTAIISSAGAIVAQDWPAGTNMVAFSAPMNFWVNWGSTKVNIPTTNSSGTTGSSGANELNPTIRQQTTDLSTGYSLTADTSGVVGLAFWRK